MSDLPRYENADVTPEMVERVAHRAHVLRYGEVSVSAFDSSIMIFSPSEEERASARSALCEAARSHDGDKETIETFVERIAASVHDAWLSRNHSHADQEERRPYAELSEKTKEKDRVYARAALEVFPGR